MLVAYGWWATSLRPFSAAATVAVVGAGALGIGWGVTQRRRRNEPRGADRGAVPVVGWLLLAAILATWQLAAYLQEPRSDHPTLSSIANAALDAHLVRALVCAGWLIFAVRLAER